MLKKGNCIRLITTSPAILNWDTFVYDKRNTEMENEKDIEVHV